MSTDHVFPMIDYFERQALVKILTGPLSKIEFAGATARLLVARVPFVEWEAGCFGALFAARSVVRNVAEDISRPNY